MRGQQQPAATLVVSPQAIEFVDCVVGTTYTATFEVRNSGKTSAALRFRLPEPPPRGPFAVRLPSELQVAPGMSRTVRVDASARSSEDVEALLTLLGPPDVSIPLRIRRNRPLLKLPEPLALGHCLVGASKRLRVRCANTGEGRGRFLLFGPDETQRVEELVALAGGIFDEAFDAAFLGTDERASVAHGEFSVAPRRFELGPGGAEIELEASFAPTAAREHFEAFTVVSDSRQRTTLHVTGNGCLPSVQLFGPEGVVPNTSTSLLFDPSGGTAASLCQKTLRLRNAIAVPLRFRWDVATVRAGAQQLAADSPCFAVAPQSGTLGELAEQAFVARFVPPTHGTFVGVARLIVEDVPSCAAGACASAASSTCDMEVFRVDMKGICPTPVVSLLPPFLFVPGEISREHVYEQDVVIANLESFPVHFQVETVSSGIAVQVQPRDGTITERSKATLALRFSLQDSAIGTQKQLVGRTALKLLLTNILAADPTPLVQELPVSFAMRRSLAVLSSSFAEFGLVQVGHTSTRTLRLVSGSDLAAPVQWHLETVGEAGDDFSFSTTEGTLDPSKSDGTEIVIAFSPKAPQQLDFRVDILDQSEDVVLASCLVRASADFPLVVVDKCHVDLGSAPAEGIANFTVLLSNVGGIDAQFAWREKDTEEFAASFTPREGSIPAFGTTAVVGSFRPKAVAARAGGKIPRLSTVLACIVEGMPTPIGVAVSCWVSGLKVRCTLLGGEKDSVVLPIDEAKPGPLLPFPASVPVLTMFSTAFELENISSIETSFSIRASRYHSDSVSDGKASELGLSVACTPRSFKLPSGFKQLVTVTCFAGLPGSFNDFVTLECDGPKTLLPFKFDVVGSPVEVVPGTLGLDCSKTPASLEWGDVCPFPPRKSSSRRGASSVRPSTPPSFSRRVFQLGNRGVHDVTVHWRFETAEGGVSLVEPFVASPPSSVVMAGSTSEVSILFSSPAIGDFSWRAIGDVRAVDAKIEPSLSTLPQIIVALHAHTLQPQIVLVPEKKLEFVVPGPLLSSLEAHLPNQKLILKNDMQFVVEFGMSINPIAIFEVRTPPELLINDEGLFVLPPGHSAELGVAANLRAIQAATSSRQGEDETVLEVALRFSFFNGSVQQFPLIARVLRAKLEPLPATVDFGPVPLGEHRTLSFSVRNKSSFGTAWTAQLAPTAETPFSLQSTSGFSSGTKEQERRPGSAVSDTIQVVFAPKTQIAHEATVLVRPADRSSHTHTVVLKGVGIYNERRL